MKAHIYKNSYPPKFDGNCVICGGKHRDAIHPKGVSVYFQTQEEADDFKMRLEKFKNTPASLYAATLGTALRRSINIELEQPSYKS